MSYNRVHINNLIGGRKNEETCKEKSSNVIISKII